MVDLYRKCPSCEGTRTVWDDPDSEYPEEYPCSACSDGYVLVSPQPSPDRAARWSTILRVSDAIKAREDALDPGASLSYDETAETALAAVEAAGGWPRVEPDAKVAAAKMRLLDLLRLEQVEAMGEDNMVALFGTVQDYLSEVQDG